MTNARAVRLPSDGNIQYGEEVALKINGLAVTAYEGESVASAMMCEGISAMRTTVGGDSRGVFCGMGVCFECLVNVDGIANTRACMTWVKDGMEIRTQKGLQATE
jgi:predicted molibdopterin-dependent oxidoreductase YjgC